jgi:hypothetical protein
MDKQRKREILAEARRTVARIDRERSAWAEENERRDAFVPPLKRSPPRPMRRSEPVTQEQDWSAWDAWCKAHVDAGTAVLARVIGQEVGKIEQRLIERITALEVELAVLRNEAKGAVIDLPRLPLRERSNAA